MNHLPLLYFLFFLTLSLLLFFRYVQDTLGKVKVEGAKQEEEVTRRVKVD